MFAKVRAFVLPDSRQAVDWWLRLPMLLLLLLALGLLATLLRLYQVNQAAERQLEALQSDWQSLVATQVDKTTNGLGEAVSADAASDKSADPGIQGLVDLSVTLRRWLFQRGGARTHARYAQELGDLANAVLDGSIDDVASDFWQPFASRLLDLEDAVQSRTVTSPEAKALIVELRDEYQRLHGDSAAGDTAFTTRRVDINPATPLATKGASVARAQQLSASTLGLSRQHELSTQLTLTAMALSAGALACLALLAFGLIRRRAQRSLVDQRRQAQEQAAVLRLLDEMAPLATGDLRVRAEVSEAKTGALADSFNHAVTELRWLVRAVKDSAEQIKAAVINTREASGKLAQDGSVQAREVHRSSNYLSVMSDTMSQLSAHATESSRIADTSVAEADAGADAVQASVDGLLRIREQAEMTTRLMQRLVESSEAINTRVGDIQEVAKRTDLLALNTTIRAAAVAEQGATDDLSRLADDVAQLADVLNGATRNIASLTGIIRRDAAQTMQSMAQTVAELGAGHEQAKQASVSLDSIKRVSGELQTLIGEIASKTLRQAGVVRQLSSNMGVINSITRDSAVGLQGAAEALERLDGMASELRDSVAYFRLPQTPSVPGTESRKSVASRQLASASAADLTDSGEPISHA